MTRHWGGGVHPRSSVDPSLERMWEGAEERREAEHRAWSPVSDRTFGGGSLLKHPFLPHDYCRRLNCSCSPPGSVRRRGWDSQALHCSSSSALRVSPLGRPPGQAVSLQAEGPSASPWGHGPGFMKATPSWADLPMLHRENIPKPHPPSWKGS